MIVLIESGDLLQVKLSAAKTTTDMDCFLTWRDYRVSPVVIVNVFCPDKRLEKTNGTTSVTLCEAPTTDLKRVVDFFTVHNSDSASKTVSVIFKTSVSESVVFKTILPANYTLQYSNGHGFTILTHEGAIMMAS